MILHVWRRAMEADVGRVVVACAEEEIAEIVKAAGGEALLTKADHPSGSDRVWEAARIADKSEKHDVILNLQGDMAFFPPAYLRALPRLLAEEGGDVATLATPIAETGQAENENVVKAILALSPSASRGRALYFTRAKPWGEGLSLRHIGIYAFRRESLARFASLPPSPLERRERLEQLRALEDGMTIHAQLVQEASGGVSIDTADDLAKLSAP